MDLMLTVMRGSLNEYFVYNAEGELMRIFRTDDDGIGEYIREALVED